MSQEKAGLANLAPKHGSSRHKKLFCLRKLSRRDGYFCQGRLILSSYMHFWVVYSTFLFVVFRRADDTLQDHHTRMLASPLYVDTAQLSIFKQSRRNMGGGRDCMLGPGSFVGSSSRLPGGVKIIARTGKHLR